jgi:hypothetical protein
LPAWQLPAWHGRVREKIVEVGEGLLSFANKL